MATINISLPDSLREYVETCVEEEGYSTTSEYFRDLVREDQKRRAQARLERLLLDGLQSGASTPLTDRDWEEIREEVRARAARQKAAERPA